VRSKREWKCRCEQLEGKCKCGGPPKPEEEAEEKLKLEDIKKTVDVGEKTPNLKETARAGKKDGWGDWMWHEGNIKKLGPVCWAPDDPDDPLAVIRPEPDVYYPTTYIKIKWKDDKITQKIR